MVVAGAALAVIVWVLAANFDELLDLLEAVRLPVLMASLLPLLASHGVIVLLAGSVLRAHHEKHPDFRTLYRILLLSNVGKYLPGGIWQLGSQYHLSRSAGLTRRGSVLIWLEVAIFSVAIGTFTSGLALGLLGRYFAWAGWLAVPLAGAALVVTHPRIRFPILRLVRLRVEPPEGTMATGTRQRTWWTWIESVGLALTGSLLLGVHGYTMMLAMYPEASIGFPASVLAFVGSWVIGFVVFFVPAGLGVREGAMVLLLAPWLSPNAAIALGVSSRLVFLVADSVSGMLAVVISRG